MYIGMGMWDKKLSCTSQHAAIFSLGFAYRVCGDEALQKRQVLDQVTVDCVDQSRNTDDDQVRVPRLRRVARMRKSGHRRNDGAREVGRAGCADEPCKRREPPRVVTQELLPAWRRELRDPMVLSASSGRDRRHLGQTQNHCEQAEEVADEEHDRAAGTCCCDGEATVATTESALLP